MNPRVCPQNTSIMCGGHPPAFPADHLHGDPPPSGPERQPPPPKHTSAIITVRQYMFLACMLQCIPCAYTHLDVASHHILFHNEVKHLTSHGASSTKDDHSCKTQAQSVRQTAAAAWAAQSFMTVDEWRNGRPNPQAMQAPVLDQEGQIIASGCNSTAMGPFVSSCDQCTDPCRVL